MAIKNYLTEIPTARTVAEIQQMLGEAGASSISVDYKDKKVAAIKFEIELGDLTLRYVLPCRWQQIHKLLKADKKAIEAMRRHQIALSEEHSRAVGWRIVRDWLDSQLALIEAEMVDIQEVMLPFMLAADGRTAYEVLAGGRMLLGRKGD